MLPLVQAGLRHVTGSPCSDEGGAGRPCTARALRAHLLLGAVLSAPLRHSLALRFSGTVSGSV